MLKKLHIENFRSIVEAELTFGRVNLFIGPNGGGKSNVLEAIGIVGAALGRSIDPVDLDRKGVRLSLPRLFKSTFKNRKIPKGFRLQASTKSAEYQARIVAGDDSTALQFSHESLSENGAKVFGRSPRGVKLHNVKPKIDSDSLIVVPDAKRGLFDMYKSIIELSEDASTELSRLASYVIYSPQTAGLRGTAVDSRIIEPLGLTGGRLPAAVEEVLHAMSQRRGTSEGEKIRQCLDLVWEAKWPKTVSVGQQNPEIVPPQVPTTPKVLYFNDRYMKLARSWLSAFDASEGTLYLLFVATLLAHPASPPIFALDNVDGTLNPGLVRTLVDHIVKMVAMDETTDCQVFLTSHNPTALDALDLFNDDHRVYVTKRNEDHGQTEFLRVQPPPGLTKPEWVEQKKGRNTSVLWLEGFIEGALN